MDIDEKYVKSQDDPIFYGLPHTKQYPMPDEKHVRSAIRFFNYVSSEDEEELAQNINKMIKKFNISDLNVGPTNRFKKYYKGSESVMTSWSPIIPYGRRLRKPVMESAVSSFSEMKLKPIYFALTAGATTFGSFIRFMTNAPYSHCILYFDSSLDKGYTFSTRDGHTMIPYGFASESLRKIGKKDPHSKYALYVVFVSPEDYDTMYKKVKEMWSRRTDFRYDAVGCAKTFLHVKNANNTKYFCSGFVAMILNSGKQKRLSTTYDMYKPMDMTGVYDCHLVDMGLAKDYDPNHAIKETINIYNTHFAKSQKSKNMDDKDEKHKDIENEKNIKSKEKPEENNDKKDDSTKESTFRYPECFYY